MTTASILLQLFWTFGPLIFFIIASRSFSSNKKASDENAKSINLLKYQLSRISAELQKLEPKVLESLFQIEEKIQLLDQNIDNLEELISQLQENQNAIRANSYIQDNFQKESEYLLNLPLNKILDIYHESSQVLEPICKRVALSANNDNLILERNAQGNYWVLQLVDQGALLLPRPTPFLRISALENMQKLFETEGENSNIENYQFAVNRPAKLSLIKRNLRWQLLEKGLINLGESPLEFSWQQEIRKIRQDYEKINNLFEPFAKQETKFKLIDEVISNFNQKNFDYFKKNSIFEGIDLTRRSKRGKEDVDFIGIIELISPTDKSNSAYLKVEIDGENWLIPNAASINLPKILLNLDRYPELFTIDPGSGEMLLVRPAKIKTTKSRLWEIEQPGYISKNSL
jgi:uncharacterized protein YoxC